MLVFLDLETTGLNADREEILEVAAIVTDDKLVEVARFNQLVTPSREFYQLDEFVRDMHTKNGLWAVLKANYDTFSATEYKGPRSVDGVDELLSQFLIKYTVKCETVADPKKPGNEYVKLDRAPLAGNTISFDRAFMKRHLPNAEAQLHYRNFDVSSLNEFARRFAPAVYEARPRMPQSAAHRAMADCEDSLNVARHYAEKLGVGLVVQAPADGTLLTPQ
jgi:oligoribonuclease